MSLTEVLLSQVVVIEGSTIYSGILISGGYNTIEVSTFLEVGLHCVYVISSYEYKVGCF